MKILILLISFISLPAAAFDLKGVEVGHVADTVQIQAQFNSKCPADYCYEGFAVLAGQQTKIFPELHKDELCALTAFFDPESFSAIDAALRGKYGAPNQSTKHTVENFAGAKFNNIVEHWVNADGDEMALIRYLDAQQGMLKLRSHAEVLRDQEKAAKAAGEI